MKNFESQPLWLCYHTSRYHYRHLAYLEFVGSMRPTVLITDRGTEQSDDDTSVESNETPPTAGSF